MNTRITIKSPISSYTPMMAFEKLHRYETLGFNMPLLLVSLRLFLSVLPVALIRAIRNRRRNYDQKSAPRGARVANWHIAGIYILNLLFVVGNVLWGEQIVFRIPLVYKIVLGLGVLSALLTVWGWVPWILVVLGALVLEVVPFVLLAKPRMAAIEQTLTTEKGSVSHTFHDLVNHPILWVSIRTRVVIILAIVLLKFTKPTWARHCSPSP